jgi:hypothetical protein
METYLCRRIARKEGLFRDTRHNDDQR